MTAEERIKGVMADHLIR